MKFALFKLILVLNFMNAALSLAVDQDEDTQLAEKDSTVTTPPASLSSDPTTKQASSKGRLFGRLNDKNSKKKINESLNKTTKNNKVSDTKQGKNKKCPIYCSFCFGNRWCINNCRNKCTPAELEKNRIKAIDNQKPTEAETVKNVQN